MPHYTKNPNAFPAAFFDIVRRARGEDGFLSFPPGCTRDAKAARIRFYAFRAALEKSPDVSHRALAEIAQDITVYLVEGDAGSTLRFSWRAPLAGAGASLSFAPRVAGDGDLRPGELPPEEIERRAAVALSLLNKQLTSAGDSGTIQSGGNSPSVGGLPSASSPGGTTKEH